MPIADTKEKITIRTMSLLVSLLTAECRLTTLSDFVLNESYSCVQNLNHFAVLGNAQIMQRTRGGIAH
jgi:hypothetical protein